MAEKMAPLEGSAGCAGRSDQAVLFDELAHAPQLSVAVGNLAPRGFLDRGYRDLNRRFL